MYRFLSLILIVLTIMIGACKITTKENKTPKIFTGGAVSSVRFEVYGPHSNKITWKETFQNESGFYIDRKVWDGEWSYKILCVGADINEAIDTTAVLGTYYNYRVYAFKDDLESSESEVLCSFFLPYPYEADYDYSWLNPTTMRLFWTNQAPWADKIVVSKKLSDNAWESPIAILPGSATQFIDYQYDFHLNTSWGFTAYYQDQISQQAIITIMPPGKR